MLGAWKMSCLRRAVRVPGWVFGRRLRAPGAGAPVPSQLLRSWRVCKRGGRREMLVRGGVARSRVPGTPLRMLFARQMHV